MSAFVTRFAPSPTGLLHLGHAYSAFVVWAAAAQAGGRVILRIEDIDLGRCRPEFETAIYEDLQWLGFDWPEPVRRQSEHFSDYEKALEQLRANDLVYRCFKTRKEIVDEIARAPHLSASGPEGPQYVGAPLAKEEERARLAAGEAFAWRLSTERAVKLAQQRHGPLAFTEERRDGARYVQATPEIFGDPVIARKDNGTSYHLASVHDDALQGITHVIRGADLAAAAHLHCLLQAVLDYPAPVYRHHRLITGGDGKRLAKRDKAATLRSLREGGASPEDVRAQLRLQDSAGR